MATRFAMLSQRKDIPAGAGERLGGCRLIQDINLQKIILREGLKTLTASPLKGGSQEQRQGNGTGRLAGGRGGMGKAFLTGATASENGDQ